MPGLPGGPRTAAVRERMNGSIMSVGREHMAGRCSSLAIYKAAHTKLIGGIRADAPPANGQGDPGQGLMQRVLRPLDLLAYHSGR